MHAFYTDMLRVAPFLVAMAIGFWVSRLERKAKEEGERVEELQRALTEQARDQDRQVVELHRRIDRLADEIYALQHRVGALENRGR